MRKFSICENLNEARFDVENMSLVEKNQVLSQGDEKLVKNVMVYLNTQVKRMKPNHENCQTNIKSSSCLY